MLDESHFHDDVEGRPIRDEEKAIVEAILGAEVGKKFSITRVLDTNDGGMGEIVFRKNRKSRRPFGEEIGRAEYIDSDGVLVSITVNIDNDGDLFELDFWKVDFKSLVKYPEPGELKIDS